MTFSELLRGHLTKMSYSYDNVALLGDGKWNMTTQLDLFLTYGSIVNNSLAYGNEYVIEFNLLIKEFDVNLMDKDDMNLLKSLGLIVYRELISSCTRL